jgi:DNA-binding IclR family transcriptional regulator
MASPVRERDFEEERRERNRFLLLQHAATLAEADPTVTLAGERLWRDLGFSLSEGHPLIRSLVRAGYLVERGAGPQVSLAPQAIEYLERRAGRRRTVRLLR